MSNICDTIKYRGINIDIYYDECGECPRINEDSVGSLYHKDHQRLDCMNTDKDEHRRDLEEEIEDWLFEYASPELEQKWEFFEPDGGACESGIWTIAAIDGAFEQVREECRSYAESQILWAPCCIFTHSSQSRVELGNWYDSPEGRYNDALFFITLKDAIKEWGGESTTCWEDVIQREEGQPITLIEKAKQYLSCEFDEYAAWCLGDVYYYCIQRKDSDRNDKGDFIDSCGGFVGSDFEKNGLLEHARDAIDSMIEQKKKDLQEARAKRALQPKQTGFQVGPTT